jgi:hypothetical protein
MSYALITLQVPLPGEEAELEEDLRLLVTMFEETMGTHLGARVSASRIVRTRTSRTPAGFLEPEDPDEPPDYNDPDVRARAAAENMDLIRDRDRPGK